MWGPAASKPNLPACSGKIDVTWRRMMKIVLNVLGILCILMGAVWFLQGINILPGSFMTGQTQWAVYGAIAFIIGAGLLFFANRRKASPPE
jgi:uncharacterized membrane protein YidH (DUF202 family)